MEVGADNAPTGTTTLAPPADTVPPAVPITTVDEVTAAPSDDTSGVEPSRDDDAGDH